jgi:hypothetical protein
MICVAHKLPWHYPFAARTAVMSSQGEFDDGVRGLEATIKMVIAAMGSAEDLPGDRALAGTAVFGQMQLMLLHGLAINASAKTEHVIVASAHLRPMMLAWCRMMALFRETDPNAAAIVSLRQGCVDRLEHLRAADPESGEVARLENALEALQRVASSVTDNRGFRGTRAPGRGGTAGLIEDARVWLRATPQVLADFDAALAEADNAGPTPVMISDAEGGPNVFYLAFSDDPAEAANRVCLRASRVLARAWEQIARTFGIAEAPIEDVA